MEKTSILVIDDSIDIHPLLDYHLEGLADEILHSTTPQHGLQTAHQRKPSVILLDISMPEMDGFQVCRALKNDDLTRDIPILFLTGDDNVHHMVKALDSGGNDYVTKPFNRVELQARVRSLLRAARLIKMLAERANIDSLTGLRNRRAFENALHTAGARYSRDKQTFSVMMLDIDHFKKINDRYGHNAGDKALERLGDVLMQSCRTYDTPCRYGGEEFVVIFEQSGIETAEQIALRILKAIGEITIPVGKSTFRFTASAGLACVHSSYDGNPNEVVKAADKALYRAKRQGRDRLVIDAS